MRRRLSRAVAIAGVGAAAVLPVAGCGGASAESPDEVVAQLQSNETALAQAVDAWKASGDPPSGPPPADVLAQADYLQDRVDFLGDHPNLAREVLPMLQGPLALRVRHLYEARRSLLRLSAGSKHKKLKLGQRPPLSDLIRFYAQAQRKLLIGTNYLAAIHLVETKFGRVVNNSVAGAQGPMQFIPSTWAIYGRGGDIHDPHDAILAAARLLRANGAPQRYGPALRAYNPSGLYVDAVTHYARAIARDPYAVYYLYAWEP